MTDKQRQDKQRFAGETKPSMLRRSDQHDYNGERFYLVTLTVVDRVPVLGHVEGTTDEAVTIPSPLGEAVLREWEGLSRKYEEVAVIAQQLMPDHFHGILFIRRHMERHLGEVIKNFKLGCNRELRALVAMASQPTGKEAAALPPCPSRASLPSYAAMPSRPFPQALLTFAAMPSQPPGHPCLWSRGYNDKILHNYAGLGEWKTYLRDNPRRLLAKRTRPDLLRPFFELEIGSYTCSGIGNRRLLSAPRRLQVRVSRRCSEEQIQREIENCLREARAGTVLVSPAISPGEKRVMRAAFDAGLPTIVIMENGFGPLSRPCGEQFAACMEGRLLMLSPFPHHNDRHKVTSLQCQAMNLLATEICR